MPTNLKSVAIAIPETWTKFQIFKVGQGDYDPFRRTFVLLIFYYLQSFCVLNLELIALDVREIFIGVRKFKI